VKTAAVGGTGKVGDVITYTFAVTNTGTLPYECNRNRPNGLTITGNPIATLAVGASNRYNQRNVHDHSSDIDAGKVVNTALATAKDRKETV
jgi:hypothetical protein